MSAGAFLYQSFSRISETLFTTQPGYLISAAMYASEYVFASKITAWILFSYSILTFQFFILNKVRPGKPGRRYKLN